VVYQHPLAYLLGLQGVALLRAYNGEYDREFTEARIAEIRAMLDCASEFGDGATVRPITETEGYDAWAGYYDGPNDLIDLEEPIIRPIIDRLPIGPALDAACGTGRHAAYLAAKGHSVIGVDGSAKMLAVAKARVPGADFCQGDLRALPVVDQQVDLVTVSLALTHAPELAPVCTMSGGTRLWVMDRRMTLHRSSGTRPRPAGSFRTGRAPAQSAGPTKEGREHVLPALMPRTRAFSQ